ncbi:hypothetical protein KJ766_00710 [Patescibacteria group bacterium]|nr:hypothetical protein [Patescibacteria group bacterium]
MNFLLEITTTNYRVWHNLAVRLKELYPDSRFAAIVGIAPGGEHVLEYLKSQKDIHYEFLRLRHEMVAEALATEIDYELLSGFEAEFPQKSLWRIIAADREWGSQFMHGAIMDKTFINQNNSRENILKVFSGSLKEIRSLFDQFKVDVFLPAIAMGSIYVFIYDQVCRERRIPYIVPTSVRVKSIFAFSSDVQLRFPQIDDAYRRLIKGEKEVDFKAANVLYDEIMNDLENPNCFDSTLPCFNLNKIDSAHKKLKHIIFSIIPLLKEFSRWKKSFRFSKSNDVRKNVSNFSAFLDRIKKTILHRCQSYQVLSPSFGKILKPGQKYIYYPLHTCPEYSTQFQGTMWMDQLYLIELLAKSIPFDWIVYVKEHPATLTGRVRPPCFLSRIAKFPNVCLAPVDANSHELIVNAEMVAVVTGTSGWEAIQRGKPLISFADNFWDVLDLSKKCSNIDRLSNDIDEEIDRISKISSEERKRRIIAFFAAILKHGFELTYPQQFCYEPGTDAQCRVVGRETADALVKHLDYLKVKK